MLDTSATFDGLVARYAETEEQRDRILENRFYRNLAGALSGTQEYMAMERLHELHETGDYDLIIVDTPPTRHALDFLDAPQRLIRLLDNRVFSILMVPARKGFRVASGGLHAFVRQVGRVIGTAVDRRHHLVLPCVRGHGGGVSGRGPTRCACCSREPSTSFVLVTSARRDSIDEAIFFADKLDESEFAISALVANRVHPLFAPTRPTSSACGLVPPSSAPRRSSVPTPVRRRAVSPIGATPSPISPPSRRTSARRARRAWRSTWAHRRWRTCR